MKALVYTDIGKLELREADMPSESFVVKVLGSGVCGTDLKAYLKGHHFFKPPVVLGHEFYGEVAKAPAGCKYSVGDYVVVAPYCECGECDLCKKNAGQLCTGKSFVSGGAFQEYVGISESYIDKGVFKIPANNDAYALVEPLACVINGMEHMKIDELSNVLVIGGGPMGALFALLFRDMNTPVTVSEPTENRRALINSWGIPVIEPSKVNYADYNNIVVAVNKAEIVEDCISNIADAGTVLVFSGLPKEAVIRTNSYAVHYREVTVTGSFGYAIKHFEKALGMINANPEHFRKAITHRLSLDEGIEAFKMLERAEPLKLIFSF